MWKEKRDPVITLPFESNLTNTTYSLCVYIKESFIFYKKSIPNCWSLSLIPILYPFLDTDENTLLVRRDESQDVKETGSNKGRVFNHLCH